MENILLLGIKPNPESTLHEKEDYIKRKYQSKLPDSEKENLFDDENESNEVLFGKNFNFLFKIMKKYLFFFSNGNSNIKI